jgi:3-hydroxy acid dehydrogenase / malonic semialdehyde reductase
MRKKIALITGATSGIGLATARLFAKNSWDLILTGRRKDRLENLKKELESENNIEIQILCFDIRINSEVERAINSLSKEWRNISLLVNNAGLAAGLDEFQDANVADWDQMIDTNIKGLLYISKIISKDMVARNNNGIKGGHIINVGSIAGSQTYPKGHVYCGTKHAVHSITEGMRIDLGAHGVKVSSVSPGLVQTEFSMVRFKGDEQKAKPVYQGYKPLGAEDVAESIYFSATAPPHVNLADILVLPTAQVMATITYKESQ